MVLSLFLGLLEWPDCECSWQEFCLSQCKFRLLFAHSLTNERENQQGNLCWAIGAVSLINTRFEIMDQLLKSISFAFNDNAMCEQWLDGHNCPADRCCNADSFAIAIGNPSQGLPAVSPATWGGGGSLGLEHRHVPWAIWGCPWLGAERDVGWLYKIYLWVFVGGQGFLRTCWLIHSYKRA